MSNTVSVCNVVIEALLATGKISLPDVSRPKDVPSPVPHSSSSSCSSSSSVATVYCCCCTASRAEPPHLLPPLPPSMRHPPLQITRRPRSTCTRCCNMERAQDVPSAAAAAKVEDAHLWVNLKVKNQASGLEFLLTASTCDVSGSNSFLTTLQGTLEETTFRIKKTSQFQKMMDAYAKRLDIDVRTMKYIPPSHGFCAKHAARLALTVAFCCSPPALPSLFITGLCLTAIRSVPHKHRSSWI
jgi:hypothetical protein